MNRVLAFSLLLSLCLTAGSIQSKEPSNSSQPIINGESFSFKSDVLDSDMDIRISVALPHKYAERVHSYPVIYVLEGDYLFDLTRSVSQFMARRSQMPQSIVVGIQAGDYEHRNQMAIKAQKGIPEDYVSFLKNELIPQIDTQYRTNNHRSIVGLSPTNGVLFESLFSEPGLFKGYIALTSHLEWNLGKDITVIDEVIRSINSPKYPRSHIYLGRADSDIQNNYTKAAFDNAQTKIAGLSKTHSLIQLDILDNEEHYTMSITGLRRAFQFMYPEQVLQLEIINNSQSPAKTLREEYQKRSDSYGFEVLPVEDGHNNSDHLLGLVNVMNRQNNTQGAIELLNLGISYYPNSANLHMSLAEAYHQTNEAALTKKHRTKALELAEQYHPELIVSFKQRLAE